MIPYIDTREWVVLLIVLHTSTNCTKVFEYAAGSTGASIDERNEALKLPLHRRSAKLYKSNSSFRFCYRIPWPAF